MKKGKSPTYPIKNAGIVLKNLWIFFFLQAYMYLFIIIHSMPLTKPRKGLRIKENTLAQIGKNRGKKWYKEEKINKTSKI